MQAITQSCDVFFYRTALKLKSVDDLAKYAILLGLGRKTGINLSGEVSGLVPTEEWKKKRFNQQWNAGETATVAIGQSFVLATTLQLANLYAAIGNGGTLFRPFVVKQIESFDGKILKSFTPDIMSRVELKEKTVNLVKQGLWGVINSPIGTGFAQRLPGMDFVGKTGSVQVIRIAAEKIYQRCETMKFKDRHNAVFVGFAPVKNPEIAVAVVGEHACHGSYGAAPIARAIIKKYLEKKFPERFNDKTLAHIKTIPVKKAGTDDDEAGTDEEEITPVETGYEPPLPPGSLSD